MNKTKTKKPLPYLDDRSTPVKEKRKRKQKTFMTLALGDKWLTMTRLLPLKRVL